MGINGNQIYKAHRDWYLNTSVCWPSCGGILKQVVTKVETRYSLSRQAVVVPKVEIPRNEDVGFLYPFNNHCNYTFISCL